MILEGPVLSLVEVEILTAQGGFILGRSYLDVDDLGAGDEELTWTAYTAPATSIAIARGGKRAGVVNTMDVGTMNVTLKDEGDPRDVPDMRPNTPIRLRSKAIAKNLYTGAISDIDQTFQYDKKNGRITTLTTIVAVDAVQAHANTKRYGAIAPDGFERWEERINRLAASSTVEVYVPPIEDPIVRYHL